MKLVPVKVNVNAAPPAPVNVGEIAVSVGTGFDALIVNVNAFENVPAGPPCRRIAFAPPAFTGLNTTTDAVPAARNIRRGNSGGQLRRTYKCCRKIRVIPLHDRRVQEIAAVHRQRKRRAARNRGIWSQ